MKLNLQSFTGMVQNMAAAAQAAATAALNFTTGSSILAIIEANASIALWLQWLVVQVLSVTRLASSTGSDCDSFGADYNFTRLGATYATGIATFYRAATTQAAQVPVGTILKTNDGTQSFTVNLDTTNAAYQVDPTGLTQGWFNIAVGVSTLNCAVTAVTPGSGANILAGTLGLIAAQIPYVDSVSNAAGFLNGVNAETDAAYKARFGFFLAGLARGTPVAVGSAVLGVAANLSYTIQENYTNLGVYQPGNFVVTVDDGSGATPAATLTLVGTAVSAVRPIGSTFSVQAATALLANTAMTITCPTAALKTAAIPLVVAAINAYVAALPVGAVMSYGRVWQLAFDASPNITDVTGCLLNGGTADIGGAFNVVVRPGTTTVS